jgi:acyl-CoA thioesterase-1
MPDMKHLLFLLPFLAMAITVPAADAPKKNPAPEPGSVEEKKSAARKVPLDPALPNVLIIGDSISLGYTPFVQGLLAGKANTIHSAGNSAGTTHGLASIQQWLKPVGDKPWAVIHFNWGLHDLKRVKVAGGTQKSDNPADPRQADLATYEANLRKLVEILKKTNAKLIFATSTPFPAGSSPHRDPEDAVRYNDVAKKIMAENGIAIDDLYSLVLPDLAKLQLPKNVHFASAGYKALAGQVAENIAKSLAP